ncbi:MAG: hypothetical protein JRN15_07680, partial [Nitrososphaerota archaeon]|nr:hypothetical protein [Nitrososphaerota archaeon]
ITHIPAVPIKAGNIGSNPTYVNGFVDSLHILFYVCAGIMIISIIPSIIPSIMRGKSRWYEESSQTQVGSV